MIKCVNEKCENFNQELNDGLDVCPGCGEKPVEIKSKIRKELLAVALIAAIVGIVLNWRFVWGVVAGPVVGAGAVVCAVLSKSKAAIVISVLALALTVSFWFIDRGFV